MSDPSQVPQPSLAALGAPPPYSSTVDYVHNRPSLPEAHRNPFLQALPEDAHLVKFQTIVRENRNIIVGRVKVPIPGQSRHAFILRRYDTDAISMTTMFKVAFPGASEAAEKREEEFVVSNYDTRGTNGGRNNNHVRLAGTWVSKQLAEYLAPAYGVASLVGALARAVPDPRVEYRMSQRSVQAQEAFARTRAGAAAPAQPTVADAITAAAATAATAASAQGGSTPKRQRASAPAQAPDTDATASAPAEASTSAAASGGDQRTYTLEAVTTITAPVGTEAHMDAEIAASKQLVLDLKKEMRLRSAAGRSLADDDDSAPVAESSAAGASRAAKRSADDDEATVIPAGLGRPSEARVIRRNRRIEVQGPGATRQQTVKKVAWSAVVFGIGFAASTLRPSFAALTI